eukprot:34575-Amorphochlora_amoeboformis.AAC.3
MEEEVENEAENGIFIFCGEVQARVLGSRIGVHVIEILCRQGRCMDMHTSVMDSVFEGAEGTLAPQSGAHGYDEENEVVVSTH